ncbi:MAG: CRISPR-associated RAMP protein [Cyanobacteria bacterium RU_5_0]|nr:CRISPR-associated RAMP protein [Cyanobacteria bacterium RU_5_0]
MFDKFINRLEITGTLITLTAMRIGSSKSSEPIGTDLPVMKDALGRPIIPGSSFKGALRSRLESFLRAINDQYARDPSTYEDENEQIKALKKQYLENAKDDAGFTRAILSNPKLTDPISCVFGSPWFAGKFQMRDLSVFPEAWFGQYQERNGVAIDRDTETASGGKLYDFQVVPADTPFQFQAVIENATNWELGLLMIGLSQFEQGQIPLGGGRSRGLGVVELTITSMRWYDMRRPETEEPDPGKVLAYLQQLTNPSQTAGEDITDNTELKNDWVNALITRLNPSPRSR